MTSVPFNQTSDISDVYVNGDTAHVSIWYPRNPGQAKFLEVGLVDTRAADCVRVSYDFDRDGWKIEQASKFAWAADDPGRDRGWAEVAFIKAWGRREPTK